MSYIPTYKKLPRNIFFLAIGLFALIIVASNYLVGIQISNTALTYGALTYPFSFLLMEVLSEKYNRADVLKCLRAGLIIAFFPSLFIAESYLIAIASIVAFFTSQFLDVVIFFKLKQKYPHAWWLRGSITPIFVQLVDTMIFFHIAFLSSQPHMQVLLMAFSDYSIKIILAFIDLPLFYILAIKNIFKRA